jgi:16S rRNA (uracil1498-N3)-methyltransferase
MRNTRVYTDQRLSEALEKAQLIRLEPMGSAHIIKVLRMRAGGLVTLFNGDGFDYSAEIATPKPEAAELRIISKRSNDAESSLKITLIQALCRGEKMDWVLEKATELGVHRIVPVQTERTEVQLDADRALKRLQHWQRVVISACEQCGRARVPEILPLLNLDARLALSPVSGLAWVLEPSSPSFTQQLNGFDPLKSSAEIYIAIGPEGGFSDRDLAQFAAAKFQAISFGPRILRTETAGVSALAILQSQWGDLK